MAGQQTKAIAKDILKPHGDEKADKSNLRRLLHNVEIGEDWPLPDELKEKDPDKRSG